MNKKMSKKPQDDSFASIEKALQSEFEQEYKKSLELKSYAWYSLLALLVILGFAWLTLNRPNKVGISQSTKEVTNQKVEDLRDEDDFIRNDFTRQLLANESDFRFKWDLAALASLKVGNPYEKKPGTLLTSILKDYGKGSDAYLLDEGDWLYLTYNYDIYHDFASFNQEHSEDRGIVNLTFYKKGKDYYLASRSAYELQENSYPNGLEGEEKSFDWTLDEFASLKVGDSNTGEGGETYGDIIATYGLPNSSTLSLSQNVDDSLKEELDITYGELYNDRVMLRFLKGSDGILRLYFKDTALSE